MSFIKIALLVLVTCFSVLCDEYKLPKVSLQALKPKGFRAFLPGDPRIKLFLFKGTIKSDDTIHSESNNHIWGYGVKQRLGWLFEDLDVSLKIGQSIEYSVFVSINNPSYQSKGSNNESELKLFGTIQNVDQFKITMLQDPSAHGPHCPPTATLVHGGLACAGEVIFEDNFDQFRDDLWQIEHYIPIDHPEYPFVSYQRRTSDPTITIQNGTLQIMPKLQEDLLKHNNQSILTATLDLSSGCTQHLCSMSALGAQILPPIASGRLTSARFAFTYGTVFIRAKLPKGDWIYPEILLEPLLNKYGTLNYASGIIKIALAHGNQNPDLLRSCAIINAKCRSALEFYRKRISSGYWSDEFHEYSLRWAPDELVFYVDGEEYGRYRIGATGLKSWLPGSCRGESYELLKKGGRMAPFDDYNYYSRATDKVFKLNNRTIRWNFGDGTVIPGSIMDTEKRFQMNYPKNLSTFDPYIYITKFQITLGIAVGGTMEFRDGLKSSSGVSKPWKNQGSNASFSFWQNRDIWLPTWSQPDLFVDYVRVVAL